MIAAHLPALQVVIPLMAAPLCVLLRRPVLASALTLAVRLVALAAVAAGAAARAWPDGADVQSGPAALVRGPGFFQLRIVFLPGAESENRPLNQPPAWLNSSIVVMIAQSLHEQSGLSLQASSATRLPRAIASFFSSSVINACFWPWAQWLAPYGPPPELVALTSASV